MILAQLGKPKNPEHKKSSYGIQKNQIMRRIEINHQKIKLKLLLLRTEWPLNKW